MNAVCPAPLVSVPRFKRDGVSVFPSLRESLTKSLRRAPFRMARRSVLLIGVLVYSSAAYILRFRFRLRPVSLAERNDWMQGLSRRLLRVLNVKVSSEGQPPRQGFVVGNHLSYLDILIFGAVSPMTFVAKSEIRDWPLFGWFIRQAGTIFVRRLYRMDVRRVVHEVRRDVRESVVAFFPEGTCTDGSTLLRFHSSLFAAPVREHRSVTPIWLSYSLDDGSAADEVCYWSEISFGAHVLNLLAKPVIRARVVFGEPIPAGENRKELALATREAVVQLSRKPPASSDRQLSATRKAAISINTWPQFVPNAISLSRMVAAPVISLIACAESSRGLFLGGLGLLHLTDAFDGWLARRLKAESDLGRQLDSWADYTLLAAVSIGLARLWTDVLRAQMGWILTGLISFSAVTVYALIRYGKAPAYHTRTAKALAIAWPFALGFWLLKGVVFPLHLVVFAQFVGALEEAAIASLLPKFSGQVPSLLSAVRLRKMMSSSRKQRVPTFG